MADNIAVTSFIVHLLLRLQRSRNFWLTSVEIEGSCVLFDIFNHHHIRRRISFTCSRRTLLLRLYYCCPRRRSSSSLLLLLLQLPPCSCCCFHSVVTQPFSLMVGSGVDALERENEDVLLPTTATGTLSYRCCFLHCLLWSWSVHDGGVDDVWVDRVFTRILCGQNSQLCIRNNVLNILYWKSPSDGDRAQPTNKS